MFDGDPKKISHPKLSTNLISKLSLNTEIDSRRHLQVELEDSELALNERSDLIDRFIINVYYITGKQIALQRGR